MEVLYTPTNHLDVAWPHARPHIEAALEYSLGEYIADDVLEELLQQRMRLWCVVDDDGMHGAVVTQILNFPRKRTLKIPFAGGRRAREWLDAVDSTLEDYGRQNGCDCMEILGRSGWSRILHRLGWKRWGSITVTVKEV